MLGRVKLDKADKYFSLYVRNRDNWTCQRCGKKYEEGSPSLQNSHYFGRTKESVRFDPQNCDALDFGCHRYWEKEDREGYRAFKVKQLGQKAFDALTVRACQLVKKDRKMQEIVWKEELKKMGVKI